MDKFHWIAGHAFFSFGKFNWIYLIVHVANNNFVNFSHFVIFHNRSMSCVADPKALEGERLRFLAGPDDSCPHEGFFNPPESTTTPPIVVDVAKDPSVTVILCIGLGK